MTIAVHVRRGDFLGEAPSLGQFNRALPVDWYKTAMLSLAHIYVYRNQLTDVDGYLTIWGHEQAQQSDGSPTLSAVCESDEYQASRGIPYAIGDGLPEWLPERLKDTYAIRRLSRDLIYYGAVTTNRN
jgi:hypothetical protein